jgi:hypothetical protein
MNASPTNTGRRQRAVTVSGADTRRSVRTANEPGAELSWLGIGPPSATRLLVYTTLLAHQQPEWSVRTLTGALPADADVNQGAVRDIVLLAHRLVDLQPGRRAMTIALNEHGETALHELVRLAANPDQTGRPSGRACAR